MSQIEDEEEKKYRVFDQKVKGQGQSEIFCPHLAVKGYFKKVLLDLVSLFLEFYMASTIKVILQLGSKQYPISEIQVVRPGVEPQTPCSTSQKLNHYCCAFDRF